MPREMKDSRIEWIGEIPSHWSISRLKDIFTNSVAGEVIDKGYWNDGTELLYSCQKTPMKSDYPNFPERKRVGRNDLLLTRNATPYIFIPVVGSIYSNVVQKITLSDNADRRFVRYVLKQGADAVVVNGDTIPSYNMGVWSNIKITLPPLAEQKAVADFLDKKCAEIDAVIEQTKATIEEYKKLKQSVITEAVTKGIRGDRPMKDSGNIWYGCIPMEWDIRKLKYVFTIKKDIAGKEGYTVLSITQKGVVPKNISSNEGQLAENYSNYQLVAVGDFAMNHMDLLTGWIDISKYEGVTSPDYRVFVLNDTINNCKQYYLYLMQICYSNRIFYGLGQGVSGMGRWRLQADKFLNFIIPVPPAQEQKEIANYLDQKCAEIDTLIEKKTLLLEEMEALKKSTIFEYVTGKKKVLS